MKKTRILCVGLTPCLQRTLFFDRFTPGAVNRAVSVRETASGKAVNVARVGAALGVPATVLGFVGGETGKRFVQFLDGSGLEHRLIECAAPTRICQTLVDRARADGSVTELVEEAVLPDPDAWRAFDHLFRATVASPDVGLVVISGSPPPGSASDIYHRSIRIARDFRIPVLLDSQKSYLLEALAARPWCVKLNREELAASIGRAMDSEAALREGVGELRNRGGEHVMITDGPNPALVAAGRELYTVEPPVLNQVINPIGSGDALSAGIAVGTLRGFAFPEAVRLGMACGAANALTDTAGVVEAERVHQFFERTE